MSQEVPRPDPAAVWGRWAGPWPGRTPWPRGVGRTGMSGPGWLMMLMMVLLLMMMDLFSSLCSFSSFYFPFLFLEFICWLNSLSFFPLFYFLLVLFPYLLLIFLFLLSFPFFFSPLFTSISLLSPSPFCSLIFPLFYFLLVLSVYLLFIIFLCPIHTFSSFFLLSFTHFHFPSFSISFSVA